MTPLSVVPLDDAKLFLKVDFDDDDTLITGIIASAVSLIEQKTQYRLYNRIETQYSDGTYNVDLFQTPLNSVSVQTVDSVSYTNVSVKREPARSVVEFVRGRYNIGYGSTVPYDPLYFPTDYLNPSSLPLYTIVMNVGYTDVSLIPFSLIQAVKSLITYMYENRDIASAEIPNNILMEIAPFMRSPMF